MLLQLPFLQSSEQRPSQKPQTKRHQKLEPGFGAASSSQSQSTTNFTANWPRQSFLIILCCAGLGLTGGSSSFEGVLFVLRPEDAEHEMLQHHA